MQNLSRAEENKTRKVTKNQSEEKKMVEADMEIAIPNKLKTAARVG